MKIKLPFVLCVLFLTGCATKVWYQPDKSAAEAHRALANCKLKSTQISAQFGPFRSVPQQISDGNTLNDFIKNCMMAEGWMLTPANTITNGDQYPHK